MRKLLTLATAVRSPCEGVFRLWITEQLQIFFPIHYFNEFLYLFLIILSNNHKSHSGSVWANVSSGKKCLFGQSPWFFVVVFFIFTLQLCRGQTHFSSGPFMDFRKGWKEIAFEKQSILLLCTLLFLLITLQYHRSTRARCSNLLSTQRSERFVLKIGPSNYWPLLMRLLTR